MFSINVKSQQPIYEQIQYQIIEFIAMGFLKPNEQLPAIRSLAHSLGINPNTVQKSYQECERDGYIYSIQGKGSFVSENLDPLDLLRKEKVSKFKELVSECLSIGVTAEHLSNVFQQLIKEKSYVENQ